MSEYTAYDLTADEVEIIEKRRKEQALRKIRSEIFYVSTILYKDWIKREYEDTDYSFSGFSNSFDGMIGKSVPEHLSEYKRLFYEILTMNKNKTISFIDENLTVNDNRVYAS